MISLQNYLYDPCGTASIPYWKQKGLIVPENMKIIHERDYVDEMFRDYNDEPYFRLYNNLKDINKEITKDVEIVSGIQDVDVFVQLINACYSDLSVTTEQMESYRETPVYCSDLWILLKEKASGVILAGGIADDDKEAKELILEWIQVIPTYRGVAMGN